MFPKLIHKKPIKAIFFDLDNTLIDRNAAHTSCVKQFFAEFLPQYLFESEQINIEQEDNWGYTPRSNFCHWFIQRYHPEGWDESSFWEYIRNNISLFVPPTSPELVQLIQALQKQYRLGIITNGSTHNQGQKMQQAQLTTLFEAQNIYISQQYGLSKPNKGLFEEVLHQQGLQAQEILFVGDDPINDIWGATQLQMPTAWLHHQRMWTKQDYRPTYILNNLLDLQQTPNNLPA